MSRRRHVRKGPPRCNQCKQRIVFFRSPFTGAPRTFDPAPAEPRSVRPVDGHLVHSYPIESGRAWKYSDLVQDLMVRRECSQAEAEQEAADMPWHYLHVCPTTPERHDTEEESPR